MIRPDFSPSKILLQRFNNIIETANACPSIHPNTSSDGWEVVIRLSSILRSAGCDALSRRVLFEAGWYKQLRTVRSVDELRKQELSALETIDDWNI